MITKKKRPACRSDPIKSTTRTDARPDVLTSAFDPLSLWRTLRADQTERRDLAAIDDLLSRTAILGRSDWRAAVEGDAAAAIRLAISFFPIDEITPQVDLAMIALLRRAIGGDAAAAAALSLVLRNLPGRFALHQDISKSWLVRNVLSAYGKSARPLGPHLP
jgi:hypothetical protein